MLAQIKKCELKGNIFRRRNLYGRVGQGYLGPFIGFLLVTFLYRCVDVVKDLIHIKFKIKFTIQDIILIVTMKKNLTVIYGDQDLQNRQIKGIRKNMPADYGKSQCYQG